MSCIYCIHYQGLHESCLKGITVQNLSESFNCEYYTYDGKVKVCEDTQ